uniref:Probable membrane transporter protein n=1 Tax=Polynucleobacter necessarius subsp. necessarius (strain STIR1) TaxID=452638 RepID=B1XSL6_POLNS
MNTLVRLDERLIEITLGIFLILLIPIRRWMRRKNFYLQLWQMSLVGAAIGYLTGVVATTGAINTPFFLAYGLSKGAYLGTEVASTLSILFTKGIAFHQLGFLNTTAVIQGLLIGGCVLVGAIFSKKIVLALPEKKFLLLMELVMLLSGLSILMMSY